MKIQNVLNCQFQKWYPAFKSVTFKTKIHKLSQDFIDYLHEDGIVLHEDYAKLKIDNSTSENLNFLI